MPGRVRTFRLLLALFAALLLCGCSSLRLAYNNIDEVGYWWLDGYLDLERPQTQRTREDIDALHAWHRARELPRIEAFLHQLEKLAPGEVSPTQACSLAPQVRGFLKSLVDRAEPALVTLATSLSPDQLAHLEQKYHSKNAEYREDWLRLTPRELEDKRFETALERGERIYGRLEPAQRAVMRQQIQNTAFNPERSLAERRARQQDTLRLLRGLTEQRGSMADARQQVHATLERVFAASRTGYQEQLVQENCRVLSAVHNSTTPAQRETAVERLRGWQRDLRELSAQP